MKKLISILCAASLVLGTVTALTGCGDKEKSGGTISIAINAPAVAASEGTAEDNRWTRYIKEQTGLDINWISIPQSDMQTKLNTLLAAGEAPDMFAVYPQSYVQSLVYDGMLMPLDDLIEEHSTEYKEYIKENSDLETWTKFDGTTYAFTNRRPIDNILCFGMWIRQDWLDKRFTSILLCLSMLLSLAISVSASEAPPPFSTIVSSPLEDDVESSSTEYTFYIEGIDTPFVLLRPVNAGDTNGYFILRDIPAVASSIPFYSGSTAPSEFVYDSDDTNSIAYKINQETFWNSTSGNSETVKMIPDVLRDYLIEHKWWVETATYKDGLGVTRTKAPYYDVAKVALLSYTEYDQNRDRIGYYDSIYTRPTILRSTFSNVVTSAFSDVAMVTKHSSSNPYRLSRGDFMNQNLYGSKRICFYLDKSFFDIHSIDTERSGAGAVAELQSDLRIGVKNESLLKTDTGIKIGALVDNRALIDQDAVFLAAVYDGGVLKSAGSENVTLSAGTTDNELAIDITVSEADITDDCTIKLFAFNDKRNLKPLLRKVGINKTIAKLIENAGSENIDICLADTTSTLVNYGDDCGVDVDIYYMGSSAKNYNIEYSINGGTAQVQPTTVSPFESSVQRIDLSSLDKGIYNIDIAVKDGDGTVLQENSGEVAVVKLYEPEPLSEYSKTSIGIDYAYIDYTDGFYDMLKSLGMTKTRSSLNWRSLELSKKGTFKIEEPQLKTNLNNIARTDLTSDFLLLGYGNKYYTANDGKFDGTTADGNAYMRPPTDVASQARFIEYAKAVPTFMKSEEGDNIPVARLEIWNEPNLPTYWNNDGTLNETDADEYLELMKNTALALKNEYGDKYIITAGALATGSGENDMACVDYLEKLYNGGLMKYVDEVSIHPYMDPKNPDTGKGSDGTVISVPVSDYMNNIKDRFTKPMSDHGGWIDVSISEVGWSTYVNGKYGTLDEDQAVYSVKALVYSDVLGVSAVSIYQARDKGTDETNREHNFGIFENDNTLKLSALTLSQYQNVNSNAQYIGVVELADGVNAYVYEKLGKPHMIAWKTEENKNNADTSYTLPVGATAEDMYGNPISGSTISIGTEPVYIYNIGKDFIKLALDDLSILYSLMKTDLSGFNSFSDEQISALNSFGSLTTTPETASEWQEYMDAVYKLGELLIAEWNNDNTLAAKEVLMQKLFELHKVGIRMAAAFATYDASCISSDTVISNTKKSILEKKGNDDAKSLIFTDAIMRYANSVAYKINEQSFFDSVIPEEMRTYVNSHRWWTEKSANTGILCSEAKLALPSYTEYYENRDRIGYDRYTERMWYLRTPVVSKTATGMAVNGTNAHGDGVTRFNEEKLADSWYPNRRVVFYINPEFFKNVKVNVSSDATAEGGKVSAIADVLIECMSTPELLKLGYTAENLAKIGISVDFPTIKDVTIRGKIAENETVYADYTWEHTKGTGEGESMYQWFRDGVAIVGETNDCYTITSADLGKKLTVEVAPIDVDGGRGVSVMSSQTGNVSSALDTAVTEVGIQSGGMEITEMDSVTDVTAGVKVDVDVATGEEKTITLTVAVYNKITNQLVKMNTAVQTVSTDGEIPLSKSVTGFEASADNFVRVFVTSKSNLTNTFDRPEFGYEKFSR